MVTSGLMTLEQLMAFSLTTDYRIQARACRKLWPDVRDPYKLEGHDDPYDTAPAVTIEEILRHLGRGKIRIAA
jgi:hypothetical protein